MERVGKAGGLKDEQADDALGPGRTGLQRRRDDDVVGARHDAVPARRVEVMASVDAGALWEESGHAVSRPEMGARMPISWRLCNSGGLVSQAMPDPRWPAAQR